MTLSFRFAWPIALAMVAMAIRPAFSATSEELITTAKSVSGESIPYVLNTGNASPKYLVILFPGGNGVVNPHLEDGRIIYQAGGNFLVRSRKFIVDDEFATITTDTTRSEERIQAIIDDLTSRFPAARIYLMGTSRGTEATISLARYLSTRIAGEIHTSSMAARIYFFNARDYPNRHLVVHHRNDSCRVTGFASAERSHEVYGNELIVMDGGISTGDPCEAFAYHGYNGIEKETMAAIKQWIRRGP